MQERKLTLAWMLKILALTQHGEGLSWTRLSTETKANINLIVVQLYKYWEKRLVNSLGKNCAIVSVHAGLHNVFSHTGENLLLRKTQQWDNFISDLYTKIQRNSDLACVHISYMVVGEVSWLRFAVQSDSLRRGHCQTQAVIAICC